MKKAFIQLHVAVFLAGFTAILGKLITLNEGLLVWYRMLITAIVLGVFLYFKNEIKCLSLKSSLQLFGVGAIVAMHWVTFYGSIKYSNVSVSLTCLSAIGFFTAFIEPLIMHRRIDVLEIFLGLLAIAGIYLIFNFYPQYKVGILFGIISAMLASIFPILNKNLLKKFSAKNVTVYEMIGGVISLTLIIPFYLKQFPAAYYFPTAKDWIWLLILSLLCTAFTFILALNALKKISPFTANLAYNLEPVYGIILAFIIFHENKYLSAGFYYGLALILLAVILQMWRVYYLHRKNKNEFYP
ncbi:MAG: DMT family transporter [Bacteroidota bacterium]|nr:DMT family transporter [Bacteroidota bacterium]